MTKLIYNNYLKVRDFNIDEEYYKLFKDKETQFEELKTKSPYDILFSDIEFKDIIFFDKLIIQTIESRINIQSHITPSLREDIRVELQRIFNYEGYNQSKKITPFFTNNFNFRTCFYCNKDFINNFEENTDKLVSTFQLDHFYDKGTYPYLALSFYNFIPSCPTCNSSKVKGTQNCFGTCIAPNDKNFEF